MTKKILILLLIFCSLLTAGHKRLGSHSLLINEKGYLLPENNLKSGMVFAINTPVKINGTLSKSLITIGECVIINGEVGKNIYAFGCNIRVNQKAKVAGSVVSFGGSVVLEEGAEVKGIAISVLKNRFRFKTLLFLPFTYLSFIILGYFLNFFFLNNFVVISEAIKVNFFKYFLWGLLLVPLLFILGLALMGTIVGTALMPVLIFMVAFLFFFAVYSISLVIGEGVVKTFSFKDYPFFEQFLGVTILFFLSLVPIFGKLIFEVLLFSGLGATIKNKFGVR